MNLREFKVGDMIKYTGKSINGFTKGKIYTITRKYKYFNEFDRVVFLDDNNREKGILLDDNKWRTKFKYFSNIRKEKLNKINELGRGSDLFYI